MSINDSGHRPHGTHFHQEPRFGITHGPESLHVTLDTWGPQHNLFPALYDMLQANWGDSPSRTVENDRVSVVQGMTDERRAQMERAGWHRLTPGQQAYIDKAFQGGTLSQALEMLTFTFTVDGVTRAFTHEYVRARIGAGFMQHGGRDNDWRHRDWTMPETIWRACQRPEDLAADGLVNAVVDWKPIHRLIQSAKENSNYPVTLGLDTLIRDYLEQGRELYAALVDAGIPWQDARRLLPIGTQTYIHGVFNYVALSGVLANRLEHIMDWEINCIAQLMLRELRMKCPPVLWKYLGSHSDKAKRAAFAGLDSWPPDGKYPYEPKCVCGHAKANHLPQPALARGDGEFCEVCLRESTACPGYTPDDVTRMHRPAQNPFWVLTKEAMNGGPVAWIKTNGVFPHEAYARS